MRLRAACVMSIVLLVASLSPLTPVRGDTRSVSDPDDSAGALDIASVEQSHGRWKGLVRHTLTTYEEWDTSLLAGDSDEEGTTWGRIFFTLNSHRFCCGSGSIAVRANADGSLYATFHREGFRGYGRAWRPDGRSVTVEFQKRVFARKLEQYRWQGGTSYASPDNEKCRGWQTDESGHRTLDACFDYTDSRRHRVVFRPDVRVDRIHFDPRGRDTKSNEDLKKEFVVIHNFSERGVSLRGWTLHDRRKRNRYRFGGGLGGSESLYLYTGRGQDGGATGCNGECHSTYFFFWDLRHYVWGNGGDAATLRDRSGTIVDRCRYGTEARSSTDCGD